MGIVGSDDTLQPNVVESVALMQDSGIKFWMTTSGTLDWAKLTAESIMLAKDPDGLKIELFATDEEDFSDKIDDL